MVEIITIFFYLLNLLKENMGLVIAVVALLISFNNWRNTNDAAQVRIIKNYPLLLPHLANIIYEDVDGTYPEYKGQTRTHYKIINKGDLEPKKWTFDILIKEKEEGKWMELKGFSFVSKKEGTLIRPHSERGFFVPSILLKDNRYDNNDLMLVKVSYTDVMDKKYCTCQWYNKGVPKGSYINSEEEKRKITFLRFLRKDGNCKNCEFENKKE